MDLLLCTLDRLLRLHVSSHVHNTELLCVHDYMWINSVHVHTLGNIFCELACPNSQLLGICESHAQEPTTHKNHKIKYFLFSYLHISTHHLIGLAVASGNHHYVVQDMGKACMNGRQA